MFDSGESNLDVNGGKDYSKDELDSEEDYGKDELDGDEEYGCNDAMHNGDESNAWGRIRWRGL
jgi:hypothetical protein